MALLVVELVGLVGFVVFVGFASDKRIIKHVAISFHISIYRRLKPS